MKPFVWTQTVVAGDHVTVAHIIAEAVSRFSTAACYSYSIALLLVLRQLLVWLNSWSDGSRQSHAAFFTSISWIRILLSLAIVYNWPKRPEQLGVHFIRHRLNKGTLDHWHFQISSTTKINREISIGRRVAQGIFLLYFLSLFLSTGGFGSGLITTD